MFQLSNFGVNRGENLICRHEQQYAEAASDGRPEDVSLDSGPRVCKLRNAVGALPSRSTLLRRVLPRGLNFALRMTDWGQ